VGFLGHHLYFSVAVFGCSKILVLLFLAEFCTFFWGLDKLSHETPISFGNGLMEKKNPTNNS